jgi:Zn-dependent peptidase ImmA (M78 family)
VDPDLLNDARLIFRSAAARARIGPPELGDTIVEPLARLALFASTLTLTRGAPWAPSAERIPFTTKSATELGRAVRQRLALDDVSPVYDLAHIVPTKMNVLVFSVEQPAIESACAFVGGLPLIIVATDLGFEQLSACSRELGHLLAIGSRLNAFNDAHITPRRRLDSSCRRGPPEYFATNFAIELLIPTPGLVVALRRVRELLKVKNRALGDIEMLYLARVFGVTFLDVARKCERAQLLPLGGAAVMMKFLDEKFGGPECRANDLGLPDRPGIAFPLAPVSFLSTLKNRIAAGEFSLAQAADALGTSQHAFAAALPADPSASKGFWQ